MEKDQSEKWNEYQKKLSTNGKNSYPANDAEKEWRASKEAAEIQQKIDTLNKK